MNEFLRDRILRKLDTLPDERLYQVLDFVEFLESKYAQRQNPQNVFTRFAEGVEDTLRAGKLSTSAISETMGLMNKAMGVLSGVAAAGRSVAGDIVTAARTGTTPGAAPGSPAAGAGSGAGGTTSASATPGAPAATPNAAPGAAAPAAKPTDTTTGGTT